MSIDIANGASPAGGTEYGEFFRPGDHVSAHAIIFEVKNVRPNVDTKFGPKDYTDADITIFLSPAEVEQGKPSTILPNATTQGNLGKSLAAYVGRVTVGKLGQVPTDKGNPAWTIEALPQETVAGLVKYLEERNAAQQAELPDFLRN